MSKIRRYSVYNTKTDMPLIIYASPQKCAAAMGIKLNSFYRYICRKKSGRSQTRQWAVYEDEVGDDE